MYAAWLEILFDIELQLLVVMFVDDIRNVSKATEHSFKAAFLWFSRLS